MDIPVLLSLFFLGASLTHAQIQMPQTMPNQRPGLPPGARPPNQGSGIRQNIRPIGQGPGISGIPPGARSPNTMPMVPTVNRNPNQGSGMPSGARTPQRSAGNPTNNMNVPPRSGRVGGIQGGNGITGQCAVAGNAATRECFQAYGVTRLQNVDALISGATMTPGSRGEAQFRSAICRNQGNIIGCIYNKIDGLRSSPSCAGTQAYSQLQQEAVSRVSGIQEICGKGPLATPDTCVNELDQNMRQCYQKLGLNPDLFSINGTSVLQASGPGDLIKAVIGTDTKKAAKFCRIKTQLFTCMQQTLSRCPAGRTLMEKNGYDQSTLTSGIDVLCDNVKEYMASLRCVKNTATEAQRCQNTLAVSVRDLEEYNRRQSMTAYQYQTAHCQLKLEHMECDIAVWKKSCSDSVAGLKTEFECNVLPTVCKNNRNLQRNLTESCKKQKFQRQLRSGSPGRFSFSSVSAIVISVSAILLLL